MTPTPKEARPTSPSGRSDKGPGARRAPTHRSDSWSTCTAPPPWRGPRSLARSAHCSRPPEARSAGRRAIARRRRAAHSRRPARCGDARPVTSPPGGGVTAAASAREGRTGAGAPPLGGWDPGGPEGRQSLPSAASEAAGRRRRGHRALPESPTCRAPGSSRACPVHHWRASSENPLRVLAVTAGAGLPELVRPAGKLSPGRRAGEEALDAEGGGKPLGQVWGALTVNGRVPPRDVWGFTWPLRWPLGSGPQSMSRLSIGPTHSGDPTLGLTEMMGGSRQNAVWPA